MGPGKSKEIEIQGRWRYGSNQIINFTSLYIYLLVKPVLSVAGTIVVVRE